MRLDVPALSEPVVARVRGAAIPPVGAQVTLAVDGAGVVFAPTSGTAPP